MFTSDCVAGEEAIENCLPAFHHSNGLITSCKTQFEVVTKNALNRYDFKNLLDRHWWWW